jgi:hypothetical protein
MARTDIAGLLTGVPSGGIDPMMGGNIAQQRLAFGAQQAQGLQRAARGLTGRSTPAEQLQMAMANLDMSNPDDLRKIAQIQQATGDLAGAAQTAAKIKQIEEQIALRKTRQQQAQEISTQLPEKYSGLAQAVLNQVPGSMEKAIDILGTLEEPPKGDIVNIIGPDRKVVGIATEIDGKLFNQKGQPLKLPANYGVSSSIPGLGIRVGEDPLATVKAKALETKLADQRTMFDDVEPKQEIARKQLETANRLYRSLEKGTPSGAVAESLLEVVQNVQSTFSVLGLETPDSFTQAISEGVDLTNIGFKAMEPLIEAQGRGFTDKDREHAKKVLPGLSQSWQYNEMIADLNTLDAYKTQDQMIFANKRKNLDEITDQSSQTLWTSYLNDLPMSKTEVINEGTEASYTRLIPIKTNEDLSQYWVKKRPRGFKIKIGSEVVSKNMADINKAASDAGFGSTREFLAALSAQGFLIDGVYE